MEPETGTRFKKWLVTGAVAAGAAIGAAGISAAATTPAAPVAASPTQPAVSGSQGNENTAHEAGETAQREADEKAGKVGHGGHSPETAVTGANADKIKSAALAAVPGTVNKTEQRADGTYEAEITKADGTEVHVSLGQDFAVTSTRTPGAQGGDIGK